MATANPILKRLRNLVVSSTLALGIASGVHHASAADNVISQQVSYVGVRVDPIQIINQNLYSDMACGPTSLLNSLRFGPAAYREIFQSLPGTNNKAKLTQFIDHYGSLPSAANEGHKAFSNGMRLDDMTTMFNAVLHDHRQEPLTPSYLDRKEGETASAHLHRVHRMLAGSLKAGVPVVTGFAAYAAQPDGSRFAWSEIGAHFVTIVRVPAELDSTENGFAFQYVEPDSARLREGYLRIETQRSFMSMKGDGDNLPWVMDQFLVADVPDLSLGTRHEAWFERTYIMPNWSIGRFSAEDVSPTTSQPNAVKKLPTPEPQLPIATIKAVESITRVAARL